QGPRSRWIVRHIQDNLWPTSPRRKHLKSSRPLRLADSTLNRARGDRGESLLAQLICRSDGQRYVAQLVPPHQGRLHQNLLPDDLQRVSAGEWWLAFIATRYQILSAPRRHRWHILHGADPTRSQIKNRIADHVV